MHCTCLCSKQSNFIVGFQIKDLLKDNCRMGPSRSDKVSLWYVALLINIRFHFFILE